MLMRTLLVRGMLAGLAAGALALVFAWIFGEPQVGHAIAFEDQQARLAGAAPAPELGPRTVQETFRLALPAVNEVPKDFPAVVLWRFRLASLGTQAVLWAALGLVFGALTERSLATAERRSGQVRVTRA